MLRRPPRKARAIPSPMTIERNRPHQRRRGERVPRAEGAVPERGRGPRRRRTRPVGGRPPEWRAPAISASSPAALLRHRLTINAPMAPRSASPDARRRSAASRPSRPRDRPGPALRRDRSSKSAPPHRRPRRPGGGHESRSPPGCRARASGSSATRTRGVGASARAITQLLLVAAAQRGRPAHPAPARTIPNSASRRDVSSRAAPPVDPATADPGAPRPSRRARRSRSARARE